LYGHLLRSKFQSFDDMVAGIEDVIRDIHAEVKKLCPGHPNDPIDIAGWSRARNRPESYTISVTSEPPSSRTLEDIRPESKARLLETEPFKLHPLKSLAYGPLVSLEAIEKTRILYASQLSATDLLRAVIALLEAQRRNFCEPHDGNGE